VTEPRRPRAGPGSLLTTYWTAQRPRSVGSTVSAFGDARGQDLRPGGLSSSQAERSTRNRAWPRPRCDSPSKLRDASERGQATIALRARTLPETLAAAC
jgi:hypothetical protein